MAHRVLGLLVPAATRIAVPRSHSCLVQFKRLPSVFILHRPSSCLTECMLCLTRIGETEGTESRAGPLATCATPSHVSTKRALNSHSERRTFPHANIHLRLNLMSFTSSLSRKSSSDLVAMVLWTVSAAADDGRSLNFNTAWRLATEVHDGSPAQQTEACDGSPAQHTEACDGSLAHQSRNVQWFASAPAAQRSAVELV
jgi:hypothetical protein